MSRAQTNVHIINHTHWDREWFLTSVYTSRWIPRLIDKLEQLVAVNPNFTFLFDGQTLVIEDLLTLDATYGERVDRLVGNGHLFIGPYYCQPDWQLTSGELLIRNLLYGQQDMQRHGGQMDVGWLVDTFGHISQSPQIHQLFGIEAVFVWRGVPQLEPYFRWQGADGSEVLGINLFGGYRNLYGVTHVPEVAVARLRAEVEKLRPFYPTSHIPLFDGYDLEDDPEDPLTFYEALSADVGNDIVLQESTPMSFAAEIGRLPLDLLTIAGELNSGKFGATFPGTFSARTYLKVMAYDCERLLFKMCEPLAVLGRLTGRPFKTAQYESWARALLQNAVHDCLCGVSIDQVHEKMAYSYQKLFEAMTADIQESLGVVLRPFAAGEYALSLNPSPVDQWQRAGDELVRVRTEGVGVWPIAGRKAILSVNEPITTFQWDNGHYAAIVTSDGTVQVDGVGLGKLVVLAEHGDSYSDEVGELLGMILPSVPPLVMERSEQQAVVSFIGVYQSEDVWVETAVRLIFDDSPLIKWEIDLDSRGTNFRVDLRFGLGTPQRVWAGMPFDVVTRPLVDTDLIPRQAPPELQSILLGQRELNRVTTFPMHDFVAVETREGTTAVLAKGIRSYAVTEAGELVLHLRRAVEWVTEADLPNRIGDAGPFFYVPDGRCERRVRHEVAVAVRQPSATGPAFQALLAAYHNPPLLVEHNGDGTETSRSFLQESLPMSSLQVVDGIALARFYNPTNEERPLRQPRQQTGVAGQLGSLMTHVAPKQIVTVQVTDELPEVAAGNTTPVHWLNAPQWRVGENKGLPDTAVLQQIKGKIERLTAQLAELEPRLIAATGAERLREQHQAYIWEREKLEAELSLLLNERKLAEGAALHYGYLYEPDEAIAAIGLALNRLRIKRRIFDYVVQVI